jgi:hypothetical protein
MTGRNGSRVSEVPEEICGMDAGERLARILIESQIQAYPAFGGASKLEVTCLSECTPAGIRALVNLSRYEPFGIAFTKDYAFQAGAGPVFYVRGDEWDDVAVMPESFQARAIRLWPGPAGTANEILTDALRTESDWRHEREWRVRGSVNFQHSEIAFLLFPGWDERVEVLTYVESHTGAVDDLAHLPFVLVDAAGAVEGHGITL